MHNHTQEKDVILCEWDIRALGADIAMQLPRNAETAAQVLDCARLCYEEYLSVRAKTQPEAKPFRVRVVG